MNAVGKKSGREKKKQGYAWGMRRGIQDLVSSLRLRVSSKLRTSTQGFALTLVRHLMPRELENWAMVGNPAPHPVSE